MQPRKLPDTFPHKIRSSGSFTLILLNGDKEFSFENSSPLQKDALIDEYRSGDSDCVLLLAWTGQYKTDIFELTEEDLDKHYK